MIPMSYPYHYVDYSNPTTPRVYTWDIEQDAAQAVQPQSFHVQDQQQQQQQHQEHAQPQPQLEDTRQQSQRLHQTVFQPPTIQLQERRVPSQYRFDNITEEHFLQAATVDETRSETSSRRGASKPPPHVTKAERPSVSPTASSAGAGPSAMPARVAHGRHVQHAHPYRRPSSAASSSGARGAPTSVRVRRESEMPHPMMPSPQAPASAEEQAQLHPSTSAAGSAGRNLNTIASAAAISAMAVSCPAAQLWRDKLLRGPDNAVGGTSPALGGMPTPAQAQAFPGIRTPEPPRRYTIRMDVQFDAADNMLTAMLELPGVRKADLRLTLATCPYSRVRQLTIAGTVRSTLTPRGHTVQERKFGEFARTLVVPPETKSDDVHAVMEDGILTLKIPGGHPAEAEPPQEIAIQ